jgi:hypothetical protein
MAEASSPADVASVVVPNLTALVTDGSYRTAQDRASLSAVLVSLIAHVEAGSEAALRIVNEVRDRARGARAVTGGVVGDRGRWR